MQLHTIGNYNQLRLNTLTGYESNIPYAYVDTEGIATIGIGLNLRTHGMLVLQALGFDVTGTQLKGAALEAEQKYINQFVDSVKGLFFQKYPSNSKLNNQALAQFKYVDESLTLR